jgi:hypothetical protein
VTGRRRLDRCPLRRLHRCQLPLLPLGSLLRRLAQIPLAAAGLQPSGERLARGAAVGCRPARAWQPRRRRRRGAGTPQTGGQGQGAAKAGAKPLHCQLAGAAPRRRRAPRLCIPVAEAASCQLQAEIRQPRSVGGERDGGGAAAARLPAARFAVCRLLPQHCRGNGCLAALSRCLELPAGVCPSTHPMPVHQTALLRRRQRCR